jgi:SAM-dependent methyltransferase
MLTQEAIWFETQLARHVATGATVVNLGSNTADFRERQQPHIERHLFAPLRERGVRLVHVDLLAAEGVDLAGDLCSPQFRQRVRQLHADAIICSNLLEHLAERGPFCDAMVDLLEPGGIALLSRPRQYPYHPDPIDTLFRPDVEELRATLSGLQLVEGEVVPCGTLRSFVGPAFERRLWLRFLAKVVLPLRAPHRWALLLRSFGQISATCAVFRKPH